MDARYTFIAGMVVGVLVMFLFCYIRDRSRHFGTIRFYQMEPDEAPIMTAELDRPVDDIRKYVRVIFKVSHN